MISSLLIEDGDRPELFERILDVFIAIMQSTSEVFQRLDAEPRELLLLAWRNFHPESAAY
jgi:hypothetical protein